MWKKFHFKKFTLATKQDLSINLELFMIPKLPLLLLIRKRDIVVVANDATEAFMSISWATFMHPACWQKTLRSVRTTWQMKTAAYIQSRDRKWGTWWLGNPFIFATCKGKKKSTWCLRQLRHKFDIEAFLFINERTVRMGTVMIQYCHDKQRTSWKRLDSWR